MTVFPFTEADAHLAPAFLMQMLLGAWKASSHPP